MWRMTVWGGLGTLTLMAMAAGVETTSTPARTRPEMKRRIEALKERSPRLPFPPLSDEERTSGRRIVNNGRMRSLYLPESWLASRAPQPPRTASGGIPGAQAPDYPFKTRLFWIVSRTNDCQYCLGHQELKLRRAGMTEDQIAALDSRWDLFPEAERAAMRLTRKITLTPHLVTDADLQSLKPHFTEPQIVDLLQTVAGYNSTNRWTTATGIPQDRSFGGDEPSELDTPTSPAFANVETQVAPVDYRPRPDWESPSAVDAAIRACKNRTPLVVLPTLEQARAALAAETPGVQPPHWCRVLAGSPESALRAWRHRQALVRDGQLPAKLKALVPWVTARENRAWYAAHHARQRLNALGVTDEMLFAIPEQGAPLERTVVAFTRKLTSAPHTIEDRDVADLRALLSDHEVAELLFLICDANAFDRLTEMLRLPLEEGTLPSAT